MTLLRKFRFSMALVMMLVATSAAASALFIKVYRYVPASSMPYFKIDVPVLFLMAIVLTATALGALKSHSIGQILFQIMVICLAFLSLISLGETGVERPLRYWFQCGFGLLVTLPLLIRRYVKTEMERGPRRTLWKKRSEATFFAFLSMNFVLIGILLEILSVWGGTAVPSLRNP